MDWGLAGAAAPPARFRVYLMTAQTPLSEIGVYLGRYDAKAVSIPPTPMQPVRKIFPALLLLASAQFALTGCVADGGGGGGVYYGGDPWIQSDVVVTGGGRGWFGGHDDHHDAGYVHPSGGHPAAHAEAQHPSAGGGGRPSGGGDDHKR